MSMNTGKPSVDEAWALLKEGNARFVAGQMAHPRSDTARLKQAGTEDQGDHAYATVLTCSDSRVPPELIFDAGVMDLFVIRVAGNVCNTDEIGCIEYGLAHVHTPVLLILGHTQCGAVTTVTKVKMGQDIPLERNIPPLVAGIEPAVSKAMAAHPAMDAATLLPFAIEENVWAAMENLFMASPTARDLVKRAHVKALGAIYDVATGKVTWLSEFKTSEILNTVESNPDRAIEPMA